MSERLVVNIIGQAGAGKSTLSKELAKVFGFEIFRPSDSIRAYAKEHEFVLACRADYEACHRRMIGEDSDIITRPIIESDASICIDGLRVIPHAQLLRREVGMRTLALECAPEECFRRIKAGEEWRSYRDSSRLNTFADYLRDRASDNDSSDSLAPNVFEVMKMHDLSAHPLDANQPADVIFTEAASLLQPLFAEL